jgi:hypothetical protein
MCVWRFDFVVVVMAYFESFLHFVRGEVRISFHFWLPLLSLSSFPPLSSLHLQSPHHHNPFCPSQSDPIQSSHPISVTISSYFVASRVSFDRRDSRDEIEVEFVVGVGGEGEVRVCWWRERWRRWGGEIYVKCGVVSSRVILPFGGCGRAVRGRGRGKEREEKERKENNR